MFEGIELVQLPAAIEALLFVSDEPVSAIVLAKMFDENVEEIELALQNLKQRLDGDGRGIQLREVAGGWRLYTHPAYHDIIQKYVLSWDTRRMSSAALETLAIVAYSQPVTRAQISAIRGVASDTALSTLVDRGYVREVGTSDAPGNPLVYGTTQSFLERYGLRSIADLPDLEEFAPDEKTFEYLKGKEYAPKGGDWDKAVEHWKTLRSGEDAVFDREVVFDAADIEPMITYGTNPGMGTSVTGCVPKLEDIPAEGRASFCKSLDYMGFKPGDKLLGKPVDYVFLGACTNGRLEDFRAFASVVKGRRKAPGITAWLVPGSWEVLKSIRSEGLDKVLAEAGFEIRQPGCSACLAMNDDKVPSGKYCVSTSNRNFEGRQGPGARTLLASPLTAAAAAVTGVITDPRSL